MAKFLAEPCRYSHLSSKEENQIRKIFYGHWEKLKNQLEDDISTINKWCSTSIQEIKSYADQQIRLLKFDYNYQRNAFNEIREQYLSLAKAYHETREENLFDELSHSCKLLNFQVAKLKYIASQNERPQVETTRNYLKEANEKRNSNPSNQPITSKSNGINQELATASSNLLPTQNQAITSSDKNLVAKNTNDEDSNDKCPICFMIFPSNMTHNDRYRHVNEHIADDGINV